MAPTNVSSGWLSTTRFTHASGPAAMVASAHPTGSSAHQPGKGWPLPSTANDATSSTIQSFSAPVNRLPATSRLTAFDQDICRGRHLRTNDGTRLLRKHRSLPARHRQRAREHHHLACERPPR